MKRMGILLLVVAMLLTSIAAMTTVSAATGIKVQEFNGGTAATVNTLNPNFNLVNTGTDPITLSNVKIRYYFTNDGTQADSFACDWATAGNGNITGTFGTVTGASNADTYCEIGFTSAAGTLAAGAGTEIKIRVWKSDWSNFTQTNDYSFNASATSYVDAANVTVYISGTLYWGIAPGGTVATPTPTPSGATATPTPTSTPTPTPSGATATPTPSAATATPTPTPATATATATPTPTPSTATPTPTPTPSATSTPVANAYYVSTTGSDSNAGTITAPFKTITKAVSLASAGTTIYVRGGTYSLSSVIDLTGSGSSGKMINIWAYPGEKPVLDFSGEGSGVSTFGIRITGNYWYIKGFEVMKAAGKGIRVYGSHNTIEQCIMHNNNDSGLYIGLNKSDSNDGSLAAYNQVINCDAYLNFDPGGSTGDGGNADGFSCKLNPGTGNYFKGCRAWENSDDGWDLYMANYPVTIENCYTWHNGDPNSFGYTGSSWAGNGSGFKLGGGSSFGAHVVKNCVAFDINYGVNSNHKAYDQNGSSGALSGVTIYNCVAFNSMYGFYFAVAPTDGTHHTFKNCVSFGESGGDTKFSSDAVQANNSWNLSVTANSADFASIAVADAKAARNSDGSLAANNFARLVTSSDLIDKGVNVGIPYLGTAPDLGAYECK